MPVPKSGRSLSGTGRPPNVGHVHGEGRSGVADEVGALRQEQHGDEGGAPDVHGAEPFDQLRHAGNRERLAVVRKVWETTRASVRKTLAKWSRGDVADVFRLRRGVYPGFDGENMDQA